jgi:hypothetical protein
VTCPKARPDLLWCSLEGSLPLQGRPASGRPRPACALPIGGYTLKERWKERWPRLDARHTMAVALVIGTLFLFLASIYLFPSLLVNRSIGDRGTVSTPDRLKAENDLERRYYKAWMERSFSSDLTLHGDSCC